MEKTVSQETILLSIPLWDGYTAPVIITDIPINIKKNSSMSKLWRLWALALGEKSGKDNLEANQIACIRSTIVLVYIVTNLFIIAGVIHHW